MAGTLYVLSGVATRKMEDIAQATPGPKWFQIYMNKDPEINRWLVQRAKAAGFSALVLTADALGAGLSDDFIRLGRPFPPELRVVGNHDPAQGGRGDVWDMKLDLSYRDIEFLRQASDLPVVVKGLLRVEDIQESVALGALRYGSRTTAGASWTGCLPQFRCFGPQSTRCGAACRSSSTAVSVAVSMCSRPWHSARVRSRSGVRCCGG